MMRIYDGFDNIDFERPTVVSVGSFDGVHRGHKELVEHVIRMAKRINALSVVVSFEPHPRIAMGRDDGMRLITDVEERALLLERLGVDALVVAHFDEEFRRQSYEEFVRRCLVSKLGMRGMVVGYNHRLGRGSEGSYESLLPLAKELGFELERVEQYLVTGDKVSSTVVRRYLNDGDVERARELLGHGYVVMGCANSGVLCVRDTHKLIPKDGSYRVNIVGRGECDLRVADATIFVDKSIEGDIIIEF